MKKLYSVIFMSAALALLVGQSTNAQTSFIPTPGATQTFTVMMGDFFYDPGGPGGSSTGGTPGNYPNCGCVTLTTLTGVSSLRFNDFSVFATFDWLKIYDGATTSGTILYNNASGGANANDRTLADLIASNGSANFNSTTGSLTFEFNASTVVDYGGWEVEILSVLGINDLAINQFSYYPNPVKDQLHLSGMTEIDEILIFNMLGHRLMHIHPAAPETIVDMSTLKTGNYFIKITGQGNTSTYRLIKI